MTPGALSREEAAAYVGVAPSTFDELVRAREMPPARRFKTCRRVVWLTDELAEALRELPVDGARAKPAEALPDADAYGWEGARV